MKVNLQVTDRLSILVEGETLKDVFTQLSGAQEVFSTATVCGCCKGADIRFVVRSAASGKKNFDYFELHCLNFNCRARLPFGQSEGGVLYPKKTLSSLKGEGEADARGQEAKAHAETHGGYLPHNGWFKWVGKKEE